jgi:hypothetical protein
LAFIALFRDSNFFFPSIITIKTVKLTSINASSGAHKKTIMGQAQDKFTDDQLEDNLQASSTVEENSVVTESTFTLVASDPNVHHNFNFSSPSIQDSHSQGINFKFRVY